MLSSARSVGSIGKLLYLAARHVHGTLHHFKLVIDHWPVTESRKRSSVLQKEHKRLCKVLARIRRCVVRDKLLKQASVEVLQFSLLAPASLLARLIVGVPFQMPSPCLVRSRCAIAVSLAKRSCKPFLTKETRVDVIPCMSVLMTDRIAQGHPRLIRLMR